MQAIKTINLSKRYKNLTAADKVNLEIGKGELFSLLGVNGAGKTTMVKMLSCLTKPSDGDANVGGFSIVKEAKEVKRLIGVSPQETAIAPLLSVKENLELICGIHSFTKEKTEAKIKELSEQFDLESVIKRKAGKLPPTKNNKTNSLLEFASRLFFVIKKSGQIPALPGKHSAQETVYKDYKRVFG